MKEWLFLIGAIFLETFATSMLKYSEQLGSRGQVIDFFLQKVCEFP